MSHHFPYAALTLGLRFPSFGLRGENFHKMLTRSLRRSHFINLDSRSTTRAYAKSLICYAAVSSQSEEEESDEEWDWLSTWGIVQRKLRKKFTTVIKATASRTLGPLGQSAHGTRRWKGFGAQGMGYGSKLEPLLTNGLREAYAKLTRKSLWFFVVSLFHWKKANFWKT